MSVQASMSGGPNSAVTSGQPAGEQSGPGASQRVTGSGNGTAGQPEGGTATGNQTSGGDSPPNVGLAKVFQGGPEAGAERVTGAGDAESVPGAAGQPDPAGQPKGNPRPNQSNDNLPQWTQQLPKKMTSDPESVARLQAFKSLDDLVQAVLDGGPQLALPGENSTPQEIQAFYERLGKPREAVSYSFAKGEPAFAQAAFNANLTSAQADALYAASRAQLDDMRNGIQQSLAQDFQATDVLLQKEYGEKYEEAIALMQRGLGNNPSTGKLSSIAQSLMDAGLAGKPEIVRAFIELGRATSEGTAAGGISKGTLPESVLQGRGFAYKEEYTRR